MIVGIVGSRHAGHAETFMILVDQLLPEGASEIISGGASGIDSLAAWYANCRGLPFQAFPVHHEAGTFTERAHARNQTIADTSDALLAFPCKHSKGTYDTIRRFEARGRKAIVREVECRASNTRELSSNP